MQEVYSLDSDILFFPVRHHSPAAARLVRQLICDRKPSLVLIEGPSDFNDRLDELLLPHKLPIAIYSYIHTANNIRRGAFYPFCIYSPEWQALQSARQLDIPVQFIDKPWKNLSTDRRSENAYSDETLTRSDYIAKLCDRLGVEDFNALWDKLFEIDATLTVEGYLERCHQFCWHLRQSDLAISSADLEREAFMVDWIRQAIALYPPQILVITGGFHSFALYSSLQQPASAVSTQVHSQQAIAQGIALTPYTYDRLDSLTGYNAGMPNPGFYHTVWQQRQPTPQLIAPVVLQQVINALRQQKQIASTADLIAVQTLAQGLANLRGHREIWRSDLIDGVIGGLVKDNLGNNGSHPFLDTLHKVLRGGERGMLAPGTPLPPLVQDLHRRLHELDLFPTTTQKTINLKLTPIDSGVSDRPASALLHCLRILQIQGIGRTNGTDFTTRADLVEIWEQWQLHWTPEFDSSSIESAIYGATVTEAATSKLQESALAIERNAERAALLLLDAALAGLDASGLLTQKLINLIRHEGDFLSLSRSLYHLLYLYRYDEVLGTRKQEHIAGLLAEAFGRGLWLLDSLGTLSGEEDALLKGLGSLVEAYEKSNHLLADYRGQLLSVLNRVSQDRQQLPILRGGAIGALWVLGETPLTEIIAILTEYFQPEKLGDFLTGLFLLARETTQRDEQLILCINEAICAYDDDAFLAALPALRLAFAYFTPREKNVIAKTLLQAASNDELSTADFLTLPLGVEVATEAIAFEARLFNLINKYGLRGGRL
jgi:Family of unknown function (DUF5682)